MAINPFDNAKVMGDLWGRGTQSFFDAQHSFLNAMRQGVPTAGEGPPAMPDLQSFQTAQAAFQQALANAQAISSTFAKSIAAKGKSDAEGEAADSITAQIMAKIFDPRSWLSGTTEVDEALNRMAEGPRLADLWNVERKFASLTAAWLALRRRNLEQNTVMLEAWSKAAGLFSKAVNERAEKNEPLESARALMALWVETANDTLLETQLTEGFLRSQRDTLKASTDLRLAQQDIGEFYSEMFGYPTRAELDDVHKTVTELRREVRTLARAARAKADAASKADGASTVASSPKASAQPKTRAAPKADAPASAAPKARVASKTGASAKGSRKTGGRSR